MSEDVQTPGSCTVSIILSTKNTREPAYIHPQHIEQLVSEQISKEVIVVHYNQSANENYAPYNSNDLYPNKNGAEKSNFNVDTNGIIHVNAKGKFASSILKGIEISKGQFILAMDADFPYPDEIIPKMINELINSPDSIIIASKYAKGKTSQNVPFIRNNISKVGRIVARHGLRVKEVHDPLSGCFALASDLLKSIQIEGTGDEILLEILVKLKRDAKSNNVVVKEIAFTHDAKYGSKKLDFGRIKSYSMAVWNLYRYGEKSKFQNDSTYIEQKKHKSILFLSKAGRFFTVGASGLAVNYVVSYLLSNLVPNIWYIQATLVGILVSISSNFILNKIWTFEDRDFSLRHFFRQYSLFLALCSLGAIVQLSLVFDFVEYSHTAYAISLIIAVIIASFSNFLLNKKITFGEKIWE